MPNTLLHKRGTSKPSPSDLLVGEIAINTAEGKLFTENDSGYIWEAGELLGTFSGTTITYTVTVASKTSSHRYNGQGSSLGYKINGVFSPFLTLTPGNTYRFDQSDSSNSNHPLKFYLEADKSTLYSTGVTINGTAGQSGAYTEITISDTTPLVLHYQCGFHGYMGNAVFCNSKTVNYNDLQNKPSLFSGNYNDLSNKPSLFSGNYNDLSNKPSLFSGSYNDLSNKPTIPTLTSQLTNDAGFVTVSGGLTDGDKGDIVVASSGDSLLVDDGVIDNANIASNAAISGTKISPDFGSQNIETTGDIKIDNINKSIQVGDISNDNYADLRQISGSSYVGLSFQHSNASVLANLQGITNQYLILGDNDNGNSGTIFGIAQTQSGSTFNYLTLSASGNLNISNNITLGGTVDGVDIAAFYTAVSGLSTGSGVLAAGVTTGTLAQSNNNTFVASTAFVHQAIANLIDSSPSTLNTLNELAAALGDDANFSTTVTNSIATKLPLAGGTLTGDLTIEHSGEPTILLHDTSGNNQCRIRFQTDSYSWVAGLHGGQNKFKISNHHTFGTNDYLIVDASGNLTISNNIVVGGTVDGRDVAADGAKLDGIAAGATNVTNNNQLTNGAGYITSASLAGVNDGGNAASLDGIDSSQFLRSDQNDSSTGIITFSDAKGIRLSHSNQVNTDDGLIAAGTHGSGLNIVGTRTLSSGNRQVRLWGDVLTNGNDKFWNAANDGAGSGLDADKLDGQQGSHYLDYNNFSNTPTIPTNNNQLTNGAGYITSAALAGASDGGNAALLDGIDSTQFLRADQSDTTTGQLTFNSSADEKIILQGSNNPFIQIKEGSTNKAYIQWNASGFLQLTNQESNESIRIKSGSNGLKFLIDGAENDIWHAGNDGSGSGLDADKLDGIQASSFLRSDANDTASGNLTFNGIVAATNDGNTPDKIGNYKICRTNNSLSSIDNLDSFLFSKIDGSYTGGTKPSGAHNGTGIISMQTHSGNYFTQLGLSTATNDLFIRSANDNTSFSSWEKLWSDGNDGSGSGLDADLLDGQQGTFYRNASNIYAGTIDKARLPSSMNGTTFTGNLTSTAATNSGILGAAYSTNYFGLKTSSQTLTSEYMIISANADTYISANSGYGVRIRGGANTSGSEIYVSSNNVTIAGQTAWHGGNDGSGSGLDADKVDGLQASQFIRSDSDDSIGYTHQIRFYSNSAIPTSTAYEAALEVYSGNGVGTDAFMAFHVSGDYAAYFGLDGGINDFAVGGWSMGANSYRVWHQGNDGSGSGLDADLLDGQQGSYYLNYNNLSNKPSIPAAGVPASGGTFTGDVTFSGGASAIGITSSDIRSSGSSSWTGNPGSSLKIQAHSNRWYIVANSGSSMICQFRRDGSDKTYVANDGQLMHTSGDKYWRQGNDGSGSGLDADTLDGMQASQNASNATIVARNASGYIFANYFNTTADDTGSGSDVTRFYASQDNYIRYLDKASMRAVMNVTARGGAYAGRENNTSDTNYWVGSMGWGGDNFDTTVWDFGSGFFDVWSNPSGQPSGTSHWTGMQAMHYSNASSRYGMRITCGAGQTALAYIQGRWNQTTYGWHKLWNEGNDGSGSGLDADLWDGNQFSSYLNQAVKTNSNPTFSKVYVNDWFRCNGNVGIYWESHGGGWQMTDSTWVRAYNGKAVYVANQIAATGNVTAYYSDERLKEKLGDIDNALFKVNQIETFYYKENELAKKFGFNKPDKQVGVSAQSVEKVLPEVVSLAPFDFKTAEDGTISSKTGENYKTVDYEKLVPLLIESIKELTNKVKVLENKCNVE